MGFKQGLRALMLGTAILASPIAPAAVLDNLYQVQLTPQEGQSRDDAMREAMVVMLQRLAGSEVDLQREQIARALQSPQDFMSRIGSSDAGQLRIQFDPDALTRVLKQSGQPLLGPNRPGILLWGVEAGELGDRSLSPVSPQAQILKQAAQHRGVALSFPLGDLQDMSLVDEQIIREASRDELLEASGRYPAEGTLALVSSGSEENTELQWHLWLNDNHRSGKVSGAAGQAADELMQELGMPDRPTTRPITDSYLAAANEPGLAPEKPAVPPARQRIMRYRRILLIVIAILAAMVLVRALTAG